MIRFHRSHLLNIIVDHCQSNRLLLYLDDVSNLSQSYHSKWIPLYLETVRRNIWNESFERNKNKFSMYFLFIYFIINSSEWLTLFFWKCSRHWIDELLITGKNYFFSKNQILTSKACSSLSWRFFVCWGNESLFICSLLKLKTISEGFKNLGTFVLAGWRKWRNLKPEDGFERFKRI